MCKPDRDDEADAGCESADDKSKPEETMVLDDIRRFGGLEKDENIPPIWMDEELYLCSQKRSGNVCSCHRNGWSEPCFLPSEWSGNKDTASLTKPDDFEPNGSEPEFELETVELVSVQPFSNSEDNFGKRGEVKNNDGWEEGVKLHPSWRKRRGKKRCGHQRRGKGRKRRSKYFKPDNNLTITLNNCRGWISKKESFEEMLNETKAVIALLNETLLRGKANVSMKGYHTVSRNRKEGGGGGISTSVVNELKQKSVTVKESEEDDEFLVTRLEHCSPALSIINWYGQQEQKTDPKVILATWRRIQVELEEIKKRGDYTLIAGDVNRKIGSGEHGVDGNSEKTSEGGELLRDLLATKDYILVNNTELAEGGPWTWEDPKDRRKPWKDRNKSCLDLIIVCKRLLPFIKCLKIDSKREFSLKRAGWKDGKCTLSFIICRPLHIDSEY